MSIGLLFWLIMIIWLVFFFAWNYRPEMVGTFGPGGNALLLFILLSLVGWGVFGPPLHG